MIIPKEFSESVKSLGYFPPEKTKSTKSVGMIEPGESHDFGIIERDEEIRVTSGDIRINGQLWDENSGIYQVSPGMHVIFESNCDDVSTYLCTFPGEDR